MSYHTNSNKITFKLGGDDDEVGVDNFRNYNSSSNHCEIKIDDDRIDMIDRIGRIGRIDDGSIISNFISKCLSAIDRFIFEF